MAAPTSRDMSHGREVATPATRREGVATVERRSQVQGGDGASRGRPSSNGMSATDHGSSTVGPTNKCTVGLVRFAEKKAETWFQLICCERKILFQLKK